MPMQPKSHRQRVRERFGGLPQSVVRYEGGSTKRGYGHDWQQLRRYHLSHEPLCRLCKARGHTVAAQEVDHIKPFDGLDDPLRLDGSNLQSLCKSCHSRKTRRQGSRAGGGG
jgi:5-methylcytosine-specific restriction protein A